MTQKITGTKLRLSSASVTVGLILTLVATDSLYAQDDDASDVLDEIMVTAQKREQNLRDVPFSISAITSQTIDDSGLSDIQDLSQMVPGLVFAETIGRQTASPSIRGITPFGFADPTVQVLIDGFTNGFTRSGNNACLLYTSPSPRDRG